MRLYIPIACALAALLAACAPPTPTDLPIPDDAPTCPTCPTAGVTRVVDGDTLDTSVGRVRLYGVDAPERGEACYADATGYLARLSGEEVRLEDGPRLTDPFGRRLAYVFTEDGRSIGAGLIANGYAPAWTGDGQHLGYLRGLESASRADEHRGCLF